uniref:hypothetical protein n=1 Tax=Butyrivibrio sp. TaxID=28121 RepID=UPI0025FE99E6
MDQNERNLGKNSEYEELHNTVIVNDHLNPIRVIIPSLIIISIIAIMCIYTYIQKINIIKDVEQVTNQMAEYIAGSISNEMDFAKSSIKLASLTITESMTSEELEDPAAIIIPMIANTPFGGIEYIRADGM